MSLTDLIKRAQVDESKDRSGNSLFCCILGQSGAGKSHSVGSAGVKTLQLYFAGEKHGVKSSKKDGGDNIVPYCIDYADGRQLDPDESLARLREVLADPQGLEKLGFKMIFLDGLSELDLLINGTRELKKQCLTSSGKVDNFRVPSVCKSIAHGIIKDLLTIQTQTGIHIVTSCIIEVKEYGDSGEVLECMPKLSTYSLAEGLLQMFPDRVVVGPQVKEDGTRVFVFDSMVGMTKSSKDDKGKVKKTVNFSARLSSGELPRLMKADLSKLIEIKEGK